ncbi:MULTISPECIES: NAD(P)-dependent oxidoreductase [unclassified Variovorax]|jgi:nucleoside-diphosphate-sugar epimerase|uniref:NAD-dependent epimerase/dehydratase family protein n=1 Tax=unclassified Variovorax TaxID=663243 RepID=UPI000F7EC461|nr:MULTISPECIES: NAD(P)-dependent oxidoreductase [unclassified Variovorax]RSZ39626.1 NAD(P)-dependent oxidoreductase [Variovorax sp. 553]RSZ40669.1 NAD(P)-dependent oxidoreductase [Variovorax sp. 679]
MSEKVFLAGAAGAVGTALVPMLIEAGYTVYGSTRRADRAGVLEAQGVHPVVVDVFDAAALRAALVRIAPWGVVHQLTDLPKDLDPARMAEAAVLNARVRTEGTRNLVAAAQAAGVRKLVAQSIVWAYAPGPRPFTEEQPLDTEAEGVRRTSVGGVVALEQSVMTAQGMTATVLRYGQIYGPNTSTEAPKGPSPLHVEAAARAALLALQCSTGGIFNIAEDGAEASSEKAKRVLGWRADARLSQGALR